MLAKIPHSACDVAIRLLIVQSLRQRFRLLNRGRRFAVIEIGRKRHETRLGEPVACLAKRLRQPPPRMQYNHPWRLCCLRSRRDIRCRQIALRKRSHCVEVNHPPGHLALLILDCTDHAKDSMSVLFPRANEKAETCKKDASSPATRGGGRRWGPLADQRLHRR